MKGQSWLARVLWLAFTILVGIAELADAFIRDSLFKTHPVEYIVACLVSLHYIHLLRWRYDRPEGPLWDKLLQKWGEKGSSALLAEIREKLEKLAVPIPPQFESVLTNSMRTEFDRMNQLTAQGPVYKVDLNTQFNIYARAIAQYYRDKNHTVDTIFATFLDSPAITDDNRDYFDMQVNLKATLDTFRDFATHERNRLAMFLASPPPEGRMGRYFGDPPTKSRLVIIEENELAEELGSDTFWEFINWHVMHRVGLKFFLNKPEGDSESFARLLHTRTQIPEEKAIDDFIVYGEKCVFGRIETKPKKGRVTLGFHYAENLGSKSVMHLYRKFFVDLWKDEPTDDDRELLPNTHSLTELWELASMRDHFGRHRLKLIAHRDAYDTVLKAHLRF